MEEWDLYNKDREFLNKTAHRGDRLEDGEFHLVANAWVINSNRKFLVSQRAPNKSFPYKWECTGGSVLKGETTLEGAMRELKEELGLLVNPDDAILIGSKIRYYDGCSDILDVWLFKSEALEEELVLQKEEVCSARWMSAEEIRRLIDDDKFEINAFYEEVLKYGE